VNLLSIFLFVAVSCASFSSLFAIVPEVTISDSSSSSKTQGSIVGTFGMLGIGRDNSILLSNNVYYKPTRKESARLLRRWQLNDQIRVLKVKDHRYVLANLDTGDAIKTRVYDWK